MVQVKTLKIGEGMPKICVPIVADKQEQILQKAREIRESGVDIAEWRVDYFAETSCAKIIETAGLLQEALGDVPLLFTFRTAKEGGEREISPEAYRTLLEQAAQSECCDMIDVEMFRGYDADTAPDERAFAAEDEWNRPIREMVRQLRAHVVVIGSYHNFTKTPSQEEIIARLLFMEQMGADIVKIALMPESREDVLRTMTAVLQANAQLSGTPAVAMSMGALGTVSRMAGEAFGSAVTFGSLGDTSAPGQIPVEQLRQGMEILHIQDAEVWKGAGR